MSNVVRLAAFLSLALMLAACELAGGLAPDSRASANGNEALANGPVREAAAVQDPAVADPALLVGLAGDSVRALMGKPGFIRHDGPARVLQYSSPACVLDLFLYKEDAHAAHRVTHVELRRLSVDETTIVSCMRSLSKPIRNINT